MLYCCCLHFSQTCSMTFSSVGSAVPCSYEKGDPTSYKIIAKTQKWQSIHYIIIHHSIKRLLGSVALFNTKFPVFEHWEAFWGVLVVSVENAPILCR